MLELVKKAWVGFYINVVLLILIIVCLALYASNCGTQGYFYGRDNVAVYVTTIFALVFVVISSVLPFVRALLKIENKWVNAALTAVTDVLRVLIPILLVAAFIMFVSDRVEGLAYIYGSNEDVLQEVQTEANLASASGAINGLVVYAISFVVAIVGSFFSLIRCTCCGSCEKEEKETTVEA